MCVLWRLMYWVGDDGSYARPHGAIGYLAAVFHPTAGKSGEAFTAVIGGIPALALIVRRASRCDKMIYNFILLTKLSRCRIFYRQ